MKKTAIKILVFVIAFSLLFGSVSVYANDISPEERALEKIHELASILDGTYFTTTQKACNNNACGYCLNVNVTSCDWFVDLFGFSVKKSQMAYQHFPNCTIVPPQGWSCFGFSVFAQWYIFSPSNDGKIGQDVINVASYASDRSVKLNYNTLTKYAKPGDAIRLMRGKGGHSMIYVSHDEEGFTVLDSNYTDSNMVSLHKIPYTARYGSGSISSCAIAITRAANYDTVKTGTSCAALVDDSGFVFSNISVPTVHKLGKSFSLKGLITSGKLIDTITASVINAKTEETVMEYTVEPTRRAFSVAGSKLDSNMKFGSLKKGIYFLQYTVVDAVGYQESYKSDCFSVTDIVHTCNMQESKTENGIVTYVCEICERFEEEKLSEIIPPNQEAPPTQETPPAESTPPDQEAPPTQETPFEPEYTGISGDLNGDAKVNISDAIYLLYFNSFGSNQFPLYNPGDVNGDGIIEIADAIYLLYHCSFSDLFPLS